MRESGCFYPPHNSLNDSEIRFSAGGLDVSVETRATPVTELATFNVLASTGSAGSESQAWAPVAVTKSGSTYLTGKYWPAADPSYHFYASNAALTFAAAGSTVTADGSTDVVCAYLPSPAYGEPNALTFDHIYARVGSFSVATQSGYEISAVSATLKNGVSGGTYNLRTGAWSGLSAASDRACASFTGGTSSQSSSNDIWLVPGTYTISVSYTLTKGEYVVPFTKTGSVTLVAGKTNNISTTAVGGSASEIVFSVSLTSWSPNSIDMDWTPTFAGLEIAPGPLYYNGTSFEVKDSWNYDSYNSVYGVNSGSTYFNFIQLGQVFDSDGGSFSKSSGSIDNANTINGWRVPTLDEWASIVGTTRAGSTVNGSAGKHYALIKLTGVTHAGSGTPNGLLIFPDGKTISGKALSGVDNTTQTTGVTLSELNTYLNQGCAFLSASGCYRDGDGWGLGGTGGRYWSATEDDGSSACRLYFNNGRLDASFSDDKTSYFYSVRLVR